MDCRHGATSHVTNSRIRGVNHRNMPVKTRGFIGESITPDLEMDLPVTYIGDDGKQINVELKDVQVNNKFNFNLFSVTKMLQKGYTLRGDAKSISLRKDTHEFKFDSVIWTQGGALYCARFCRHFNPPPQEYDVALVVSDDTIKSAKEPKKLRRS